ncbi:glycoside hydrolase family 93 protein [Atractiella rhizophila]|nr:glycoside hydrolase family 93 protein [Atractiella rhizophila]
MLFKNLLTFASLCSVAVSTVTPSHLVKRAALVPHVNAAAINLNPAGGGTYPRLTTLSDGSILAVFTYFQGDTHILTVTKSTNGGSSFVTWGTIASQTNDLDNPHLVQLRDGSILATFRNNDKVNGAYSYYRITACRSTDGGKTWSFVSHVAERAASGVNGLWEPFGRVANDGSIQVYYASENNANDQDILVKTSTNGGSSWSGPVTVAGGSTTGRDGMPGVAKFNDGAEKLMCVFETTEGTGTFTIKSVVSADDGKTWGVRSQVYRPTGTNNNAGAPQIVQKPDNSLVVSFMTDEDTSLHNWVQGANMKIVTGGPVATGAWGNKVTVSGVQSSWPGLLAKSDGTVLGCADNGGAKCHSITFS